MILLAAEGMSNAGFWGGVGLAAAIATALATAASTATAIWWRYQDRTEAEWSLHVEHRGGQDSRGNWVAAPKVSVILQNIGDGAAHQVCITGERLTTDPYIGDSLRTSQGFRAPLYAPIPVMRTGDSIYVAAEAESFEVWDKASIEINWWPPPTRKKKSWLVISRQQRKRFPVKDITSAPSDLPKGEVFG
jgi:hypothetical protein